MIAQILIADDNDHVRMLAALALQRRGYEVLEASSGEEALQILGRERPNLIVLDILMPGLSGLQVLERVKANPVTTDIPVVMLTSQGDTTQVKSAVDGGVAAYILKPFVPAEFADRIDRLLGPR